MYIRFKIRPRKSTGRMRAFTYRVLLVESYRESGKPRQRIIAYLGSIRSEDFTDNYRRYAFLHELRQKLDSLDFDYWTIWKLKLNLLRLFQQDKPHQIKGTRLTRLRMKLETK